MPEMLIPFHVPSIGDEEIAEVVATLRSGWLTTGPRTAQFEHEFSRWVGAPHALAVNSCTAGLHLALAALGIGPGDEVITTPLTFCATVNVVLQCGATAVLADVGHDGNIDPDSVASRITERTRAIIPVHLAGLPCDMHALWTLARTHDLRIVEDAAHAAGTWHRGRPVGSASCATNLSSDAVAYSFYATKNLTTGEGGMVTTHDPDLLERMRILCLHGIDKDAWNRYSDRGKWFYDVAASGFKYNLSDIQSAIGIHQLRKQEKFIKERRRIAERYNRELCIDELEIPPDNATDRHCWHLYMLRLQLDRLTITRGEFIRQLRERGVCASVHFIPIPLHRFFAAWASRPENQCPRALQLYERLVSLPLYPGISDEQIQFVIDSVKDVAFRNRRVRRVALSIAEVPVHAPNSMTAAAEPPGSQASTNGATRPLTIVKSRSK
jgi:dTDP-4-amino-4,6-dideoxygalactose transaminase